MAEVWGRFVVLSAGRHSRRLLAETSLLGPGSSAIANVCSRIFRGDVGSVTTVLWPGHMSDGKLGNVAQSDLRRVSRAAVKATKAREELRQAINLARASGETLQDIGAAAGVSAERIRQIVSEKS